MPDIDLADDYPLFKVLRQSGIKALLADPRQRGLWGRNAERRVMTVLFCDMKGFTSLSEGTTPQGLVKVMNHYLSTMSGPKNYDSPANGSSLNTWLALMWSKKSRCQAHWKPPA